VTAAYAVGVRAQVALLRVLGEQVKAVEQQVDADFGEHPDVKIYRSQPGLGTVTGARVLGEFGDDSQRYATAKARKNYAATSRSPASPARRRSSWPATSATTASPTPSCTRPSAR
jgi:transposase